MFTAASDRELHEVTSVLPHVRKAPICTVTTVKSL